MLAGFAARMSGTSAYRGVSWHTQTSRWKAQIKVAGKDVNLGRHRDEVEAARAYDRAAICARGEKDAKLNFAIEDYAHEADALVSMPLADLAASLRGVEQRLQVCCDLGNMCTDMWGWLFFALVSHMFNSLQVWVAQAYTCENVNFPQVF